MASVDADLSGLMHDQDDIPDSRLRRDPEYEDFHFHDDDDVIPADDVQPRRVRPPAQRKPSRRLPPRPRYEDD